MGLHQWLANLPPSWLVSQATSFSPHLAKQGFDTGHKLTTMWKASWGISHGDTCDNPTTSKIAFDDIKEVFHAKKWNIFHLLGKQLDLLPSRIFSNTIVI